MNKREFLDELGTCLRILEDGEQKDILEEYSQHIDMKVESGLSEEEAIRDFGSVKELAAEILEAYHVKAEYSEKSRREKEEDARPGQAGTFGAIGAAASRALKKATDALRRAASVCWGAAKRSAAYLAGLLALPIGRIREWLSGTSSDGSGPNACRGLRGKLRGPEGELRMRRPQGPDPYLQESAEAPAGSAPHSIGRAADSTVSGCLSGLTCLFLLCVRWAWNIAMCFIALFGAMCAMCALYCLAVLVVWLTQGYPLAGITVGCLGALMCSGGLTVLCLSFILRGHGHGSGPERKPITGIQLEEVHDA